MTPRSLQPAAASDDDAHDPIDDALAEFARRRGAWLGDEIIAMTLIGSVIEQAERFLPEMVTNARLNSRSWDEIARAIGTSPEEAHLRFDPGCQGARAGQLLPGRSPHGRVTAVRSSEGIAG